MGLIIGRIGLFADFTTLIVGVSKGENMNRFRNGLHRALVILILITAVGSIANARPISSRAVSFLPCWCATSPKLNDLGGVYCENCDVADMQGDDAMARFVGVAPWAVDTEEASRLWTETEKILAAC